MVIVLDMSPLFSKFDRSRRVNIHNEHEHIINVVFVANLYAKGIKSCFVQFAIKKTCKTSYDSRLMSIHLGLPYLLVTVEIYRTKKEKFKI